MFKTLQTKNTLNAIGSNTSVTAFAFPENAYIQYEATTSGGGIRVQYVKTYRRYNNFDTLVYEAQKQFSDFSNGAASFRQAAIRHYTNTQESIFCGENDVWMETIDVVYIKSTRATSFAPTQAPDNAMTFAFTNDNPVLNSGGADYSHQPFFAESAIKYTSTWKGNACTFYLSKRDIENTAYTQLYLLADANTDISVLGGSIHTFACDSELDGEDMGYATKLHAGNNEALQFISLYDAAAGFDLQLQITPNVNEVQLHAALPQASAQALADMITASTIFGKVIGYCGDYSYLVNDAIDENPNWQHFDW